MKFVFLLFVIGCSLAAKKALLIGINYKGTQSQLNGCANDVYNHKKALIGTFGFAEHDIKVQTEDGNEKPTKANIEKGISWLTSGLQAGDVIVFHYSGHGSQIPDSTGREKDGKTEVLVPLDFDHNQYQTSFITDTYINEHLVRAIPKGVKCLALFDCCHSGSASNLYTMRSIDNSLNIKPRYLEPPEWMKEMFPKDEEPKIKVRAPPMGGDESGGPEEFEFGPEEFQEMMNDPEFAQMMANDPEFQQMMNDPQFQQMMSQYGQDGQDPYGGQDGQDQYGADQDPYGGQDPYGQYGGGQQQQQGGGHGNNDGAAAIHGADPDVDYWSFSGCRDDQTSADATLDGVPQGAFTWGYLSSLRDHNYDVTFEQLLNTIKSKLSKKTFPQVPVLATTSEARLQSKITL